MKRFFTLIFICLVINTQAQVVVIDSINTPNEPSIAMNPNNPMQLVAGSNIDNVYHSNDGGKTWIKNKLTSNSGVWGDPVLVNDNENNFFFYHLSTPNGGWGSPGFLDRIVCQKSIDGGSTWSIDASIGIHQNNEVEDKPWAIYSSLNKEMYVSWTEFDRYENIPIGYKVTNADSSRILFSKSSDGGITWSTPAKINDESGDCVDSDNSTEGAVPAVGINGEVYVAWSNQGKILLNKSTDKGQSWLSKNIFVCNQIDGWDISVPGFNRTNGMPVIACDISNNAYRGNIYINFTDTRNGLNNTDIFLVKSTDGGQTFSSPLKVNSDNGTAHQFLNWMSVDPVTGFIYIIFYDRRNFLVNSTHSELYMAVSKDGGESFTNEKINDTFFASNDVIFAGDYINVIAYNGHVHAIWTEEDSIQQTTKVLTRSFYYPVDTLHTATNCNGIHFSNLYPNPTYDGNFYVAYCMEESKSVSLFIYSTDGKLVGKTEEPLSLLKGNQLMHFSTSDFNLTTGVYLVQMIGEGISEIKKLTVIKSF